MIQKLINIKATLEKNRKIEGTAIFRDNSGLEFEVQPNVFSPNYFKDSVFFAENFVDVKNLNVLEIGTGTGYFAIKMALNDAKKVVATDISVAAYNNTIANIKKHGLENKMVAKLGNLFEPVRDEKFDIIFWNIPFCYLNEKLKQEIGLNNDLDELDNAVFNYEYKLLENYLLEGFKHLNEGGRLLLGFSPSIGNKAFFDNIVSNLGLTSKVIISDKTEMDGHSEILQIIEFKKLSIEIKSVNVEFDTLKVLSDVSLNINKEEVTTILGPSGSGKTTLLRCIAGLNQSFKGEILVDNTLQQEYLKNNRIALVNQGYSSFPWLSVKENILIANKGNKKSRRDVNEIIHSIGLNGFEDYYPSQLSGGMKQRVAIGRAIFQDTDILIFDEPFGALDYQTRLQLQLLIKRIKSDYGKTIVFVTHDIEEAIFISDKVVVLSKTPSVVVDEIDIDEEIKFSLKNDVRYTPSFIERRSFIENIFENLNSRQDLKRIFESKNYKQLSELDCWNTFLTNECRKFYKKLPINDQRHITLDLLNSNKANGRNIGTLLHPEDSSNEINEKIKKMLFESDDYEQTYFLVHAITRLKNLSSEEKHKVKKIVYDNFEDHVYYDRKYFTANNTYGDKVVLNLLHSHFYGHKVDSYIRNKGWLLLISSLAHSDTKEILQFLKGFIDEEDALTKETAIELIKKIENNEVDFTKIRR